MSFDPVRGPELPGAVRVTPCTDPTLLGSIHRDTVEVAYASFFPAGSILPSPADFRVMWEERLADRAAAAYLATVNDQPAGLAAVGPGDDQADVQELVGLFVLPTWWRHGVGSALHDAAVQAAHDEGVAELALWVIAANTPARRFYESRRWRLVPDVTSEPSPGVARVRYVRRDGS